MRKEEKEVYALLSANIQSLVTINPARKSTCQIQIQKTQGLEMAKSGTNEVKCKKVQPKISACADASIEIFFFEEEETRR